MAAEGVSLIDTLGCYSSKLSPAKVIFPVLFLRWQVCWHTCIDNIFHGS